MKNEPVVVPIEDSLDLHTFRPEEVEELLEDYFEACLEKGYREVRIIHGKGRGVLKTRVQALLRRSPLVVDFRTAGADRGGWGATLVRLARPTENGS